MRVVIRRSPPLMILHASHGGTLGRAATLALTLCAIAAFCRFAVLLAGDLGGPAPVARSIVDHWHLWLGAALVCAAGAGATWRVAQRPTNRE